MIPFIIKIPSEIARSLLFIGRVETESIEAGVQEALKK